MFCYTLSHAVIRWSVHEQCSWIFGAFGGHIFSRLDMGLLCGSVDCFDSLYHYGYGN